MKANLRNHLFLALLLAAVLSTLTSEFTAGPSERLLRTIQAVLSPPENPGEGVVVDSTGVALSDYGGTLGRQFNPVSVAQTALDHYRNLEDGDRDARRLFLNSADWLVEHMTLQQDYATLDYLFPWATYGLSPPWYSGMAQGRALEVLIRADRLTGDDRYLAAARLLLGAFLIPVDSGGVTYQTDDQGWWYEEYAQPACRPSHVLNGMMFALLGIHEYHEYTEGTDPDAGMLFDRGITSLRLNLPLYDHQGDSNYDRLGQRAGPKYHQIHIDQLSRLYDMTGVEIFRVYRDRWARFTRYPLVYQMFLRPTKPGMAVLLSHFAALAILFATVPVWFRRIRTGGRDR